MRKINIARGMKEKKRLISRIKEFCDLVENNNVYFKDETHDVDLKVKETEFRQLQGNLIELKTKLAEANASAGIAAKIYRMEELKSELSTWKEVDTDVNPVRRIDPESKVTVVRERASHFSFNEVDSFKKSLREEIEKLQDEIDDLNAKTFIEVTF